jgi:cytochrome c oxidase subunit 1
VLVTVLNLTISFRSAVQCPRNPWGAIGLEWTTTSPPPLDNFLEDPDGLPVDGQPEGLPRASALIEQSPRPTA